MALQSMKHATVHDVIDRPRWKCTMCAKEVTVRQLAVLTYERQGQVDAQCDKLATELS